MIRIKSNIYFIIFLLLHVLVAFFIGKDNILFFTYTSTLTVYCIYLSISSKNTINTLYLISYIIGSEVLWRMLKVNFFHEQVKLVCIGSVLVLLLRSVRPKLNIFFTSFFVLQIPGIALLMNNYNFSNAREMITFNLLGAFFCFLWSSYLKTKELTKEVELSRSYREAIQQITNS